MDTNNVTHPEIEPDNISVSARLPGEADSDDTGHPGVAHLVPDPHAAVDGDVQPAPGVDGRLPTSVPVRKRTRPVLLAGVAVIAIIGIGAFAMSPFNTILPIPGAAADVQRVETAIHNAETAVEDRLRPLLAPAASLASVAVPEVPAPVKEHYTPKPHQEQVAELNGLHPAPAHPPASTMVASPAGKTGTGKPISDAPRPQAIPNVPSSFVPSEPGSTAAGQTVPSPAAPAAPTLSPAATAMLQMPVPPMQGQASGSAAVVTSSDAPAPVSVAPAVAAVVTTPPAAVPAVSPAVPGAASPAGPASVSSTASAVAPSAGPAADPTNAPVTVSTDPADIPRTFRPNAMTAPEQVQVLNLVTEMATMVKDLRKQEAQLRADFAKATASNAGRLADFERRLALAEAKRAVDAADVAGSAPAVSSPDAAAVTPVLPASVAPPSARFDRRMGMRSSAALPVLPVGAVSLAPVPAKAYRVQAASPGLALLAEAARGGGDGAQLQVTVGDNIPGYGLVRGIAQKGTVWVVKTDNGDIQ